MNNFKFAYFVIILAVIGGCMSEIDLEKEKAVLLKTDKEFAEKSKEVGPAEAFHQYLDENGIQLPIQGKAVNGKETIYNRMLSAGDYQLLWAPQQAEVSKSADMGCTWGNYVYKAESEDGTEIQRRGKYLNVWKKQTNGSWKVLVDIGNIEPMDN
jgi:ketosteroid isomerase-like protein